jgi:membrane AbrB-like protein
MAPATPAWIALLETAAWALAGGGLLTWLHMPAGALVGAMLAVAGAALARRPMTALPQLQSAAIMVIGAAVGAAVTPEMVRSAAAWPLSMAVMLLATGVTCWAGVQTFRRVGGSDGPTALFASMPGNMFGVLVMAEEYGADMPRVAVAQTLRLAVLAALAPTLLAVMGGPARPAAAPQGADPGGLAILALAVLAGWLLARRLRWPSPDFLGALAASALLHGSGLIATAPPPAVILVVSGLSGAFIGSRFRRVNHLALLRFLPATVAALLVMSAVSLSAGWLAGSLSGVGPLAGMLAFAPGSMDGMVAIALATGINPAYVAAHHVTRFGVLLLAMPLLRRWRTAGG